MDWNWRREPTNPYLPADGSLAQMYSNDMNGYRPLQLPVQKTPNELAADAAQSMAGYTRNNMDNYRPNIMGDQVPGGQQPAPDLEGYGQSLQAASDAASQKQAEEQQALQKQMRIKEIEAEIAEIEQRIAERKRGMAANEDALNTQLAAIEARKINRQDPTSIWRWKVGHDVAKQQRAEDLARVEAEKEKNKAEQKAHIRNKLDSYLPTMNVGLSTSPEQAQQYLNTLAGLEAEASNYGIDDPRIAALKSKLSGDLPYNQMMAAIDELEDIDANFGKGPDYDRMNDAQKFEVYRKKLEDARQQIIDNNPELWNMMMRDRRYTKKFNTLQSGRKPKSKGTAPARPSTKK